MKNNKLIFQRLSFVGELGWEIYVPINISREIYLELVKVGEKYNLSHAGAHALDIMRMEKGYLHWGHDISPAENPFEAGLELTVKLNKKTDFIGKEALKIKNRIKKKQLTNFVLEKSTHLKKLNGSNFEVEVAKNKYVMSVQFNPLHDPENNFTKI